MAQITINNAGVVTLGHLPGIYTFVHDSKCNHFDNQIPVTQLTIKGIGIEFTKEYTYRKISVTLHHEIQETNWGSVWNITRRALSKELHHCRFGITLPLGNFSVEDKNELISTPIINFQQLWELKYQDQTNIDLPILRLKRSNPMIVCTSLTSDVQFFRFKENEEEYLKISTKTASELNLTIHIIPNREDKLEQIYCDIFPESKDYVYQSEVLKRKISSKYDIKVLSHEAFHKGEYTAQTPTQDELESYMKLLEKNLNFYSREIFEHIGLKIVNVCGYLSSGSETIKGYAVKGNILLNASEKLGHNSKCQTIHHEIYHMIERTLTSAKREKLESMWKSLPADDSFTKRFGVVDPVEYRCDLFATFVLDPRFAERLADEDIVVRRKLRIVKSTFGSMGTQCDKIIQNHKQKEENILVRIEEDKHENEPAKTQERLLVGIKHSCLPELFLALKKTNPDVIDDASQVQVQSDIAYVTLNPLDFCAMEYIEQKVPVEDSFVRWISIHKKLESSKSVLRLKSEDILTFNTHEVKNFLEGAGVFFEVCYLWDIAREIRPYHLDSIPFLKQIWGQFRSDSIITKVGYHDISYEE